MNRRDFLRTMFATSVATLIPLPKINYFDRLDHYDIIGQQRGIARDLLIVDYLPKNTPWINTPWITSITRNPFTTYLPKDTTTTRYASDINERFWIAYHHAEWAQEINYSNYRIYSGYGQEVPIPTGHYTVKAKNPQDAGYALMDKEDKLFFIMMKDAGLFIKIKVLDKPMAAINKAFIEIETQDLTVNSMVMHPYTYKKWIRPMGEIICDELRPEEKILAINHYLKTKHTLIHRFTGCIGYLFGADVRLSDLMPQNKIILSAAPEYVGVMPIRTAQYYFQPANLYIAEEGQAIINEKSIITLELV